VISSFYSQYVFASCDFTNSLLDREQSIVDNLLYLFSEIIARGPPPEGDLTKGSAATQRFEMKVKTQELVCLHPFSCPFPAFFTTPSLPLFFLDNQS
jgi:hypothetical protein